MGYSELYDPESNRFIPEDVAEDYDGFGDTLSYKTEVILETPIDKTVREVVDEHL